MEIESSTLQRAAELLERLRTAISQAVVARYRAPRRFAFPAASGA
jgi:hypothetical protein